MALPRKEVWQEGNERYERKAGHNTHLTSPVCHGNQKLASLALDKINVICHYQQTAASFTLTASAASSVSVSLEAPPQ